MTSPPHVARPWLSPAAPHGSDKTCLSHACHAGQGTAGALCKGPEGMWLGLWGHGPLQHEVDTGQAE